MTDEKTVKSFRDMVVWNRSIELCVAVYEFPRNFPSDELYGLRSQLRFRRQELEARALHKSGRRLHDVRGRDRVVLAH